MAHIPAFLSSPVRALLPTLAFGCAATTPNAPAPEAPAQAEPAPAAQPAPAEPAAPAAGMDAETRAALVDALAGPHRSEADKARDVYRHPLETLEFFGLRRDMTVVELAPGGGWYTDVLAPVLKGHGRYYAAHAEKDTASEYLQKSLKGYQEKLAAKPDIYGEVIVTEFGPNKQEIAPPGSADLVLTFRNVHNWMSGGWDDKAFAAAFTALKPGGVFGVVEHRAGSEAPQDPKAESGYVREDHVIALAEKAGFRLDGRSEVNANPKDTRDHPKGVWTLPPSLRLGDQDREKYVAIGESDRMTLRFVKPAAP